jgi:hypothetical protein
LHHQQRAAIVDSSVFAGALAIGAAGAFADGNAPYSGAELGVLVAEAALFAWSAHRGFEKTEACRQAKGAMFARFASGRRFGAPGRDEPVPDPWVTCCPDLSQVECAALTCPKSGRRPGWMPGILRRTSGFSAGGVRCATG